MTKTFCDNCSKNITNDYIHKGKKDYCPECFIKLTDNPRMITFENGKLIDITNIFNPTSDK